MSGVPVLLITGRVGRDPRLQHDDIGSVNYFLILTKGYYKNKIMGEYFMVRKIFMLDCNVKEVYFKNHR